MVEWMSPKHQMGVRFTLFLLPSGQGVSYLSRASDTREDKNSKVRYYRGMAEWDTLRT